jgi:diacylglycerol kinase family enzyme
MKTLGTGRDCIAWFNGRAKQVTPKVVNAFRKTLPDARVYVSQDFEQAKRFAAEIARSPPALLFSGGGDGTVSRMLNWLREAGMDGFPPIALLRLGTGNGWPNAVGAPPFKKVLPRLSGLSWSPPIRRFDLIEVEGQLSQFAGVGLDATVLHDYAQELAKSKAQLVGSRFSEWAHKGIPGYLFSTFAVTIPGDITRNLREGRTQVTLENLGRPALTLDKNAKAVPVPFAPKVLYQGPISVGGAAVEPEWGARFKAYPFAQLVPGTLNMRVYEGTALQAARNMFKLWRGAFPLKGMHDFFITKARMTFSRPMPFQVAGDPVGLREQVDFAVAAQTVDLVDWNAMEAS